MTGSESLMPLRMGKCCIYPFGLLCNCLCISEIIIKRFIFRYTDNSYFICSPKGAGCHRGFRAGAFVSDYEWVFAILGFLADGTGRSDMLYRYRCCLEENPFPEEDQVVSGEDAAFR